MLISTILIAIAIVSVAGLAALVLRQNASKAKELDQFKDSIKTGLEATTESLRTELRHLQNHFGENMRHQSDVLQKTNTHLNERMDKAAQVISDVHKELGKMTGVARSIDELQNILKAPKLRGGFGELFLGDLLAQILPSEHFEIQHRFKNGEAVDAVIHMGDKMVPIDSKFPLENFQKVVDDSGEEVTKQARRQFINDIKKHIQGVAKYIRTDEGTYDFALMYVPAENVYYEVAVKEDVGGEGRELLSYALKQKVIPVSPNTLYAYLMTIIVGLKGMQIEKHAEAMLDRMARVQKDFISFQKVYSKLGTHLENARKSYEDADRRLAKVDDKLQEFAPQEAAPQLEAADVLDVDKDVADVETEVAAELQ